MPEAQAYNLCIAPVQSPAAQIVLQIATHTDATGATNSTTTRAPLSTSLTVTPQSATSKLLVQISAEIKVENTSSDNEVGGVSYPGFDDGSGWNNSPFSGSQTYQKYTSSQINEIIGGENFIGILEQDDLNGSGNWEVALLGEGLPGKNSEITASRI